MAYTKKTWVDYPSTATMVTAFDLNHIEDGISTADANATQALNNMPTVTDTYDATSSDGMSGIAVASAISGLDTDVSVDAIETTGTHIADITVDGTKTELYAPEGGSDVEIVTEWETTTSDEKVPSEKLVKTSLESLNDDLVPQTRTVCGKALSSDITLTASDVGVPVNGVFYDDAEPTDITTKKIKYGIASVTFTDNVGTLNHNLGFTSKDSYVLIWQLRHQIIPCMSNNVDGNSTQISCKDYSGSSLITNYNGTLTVVYIAIGI